METSVFVTVVVGGKRDSECFSDIYPTNLPGFGANMVTLALVAAVELLELLREAPREKREGLQCSKQGQCFCTGLSSPCLCTEHAPCFSTWFCFYKNFLMLALLHFVNGLFIVPILQTGYLRESFLALLDIIFGILINIMRKKWASNGGRSFLDTQYTFHLPKLKLKMRASIMTTIFHKYSDYLPARALDLDISLMMGGDMACIGEKGINLSGGHRAHLALARAMPLMYTRLMMFSVACSILHNAILGPLMNQQTSCRNGHDDGMIGGGGGWQLRRSGGGKDNGSMKGWE
ncbi:hypothetical protein ACH5RR_024696 [Cinchona calisaya]|uniref:Uncharacterized protein n=1 Tax=Cinchona calisaya TaxID=153742 RepID=A0ABD2YXH0_9GENT